MFTSLYARLIGVAAILALIIGGWLYVSHLRTSVKTLTDANVVLTNQVKTQNEAVEAFKKESEQRLKIAEVDLAVAEEKASKIQVKSKIIYKTIPSKGTATCENDRQSTLDLLNKAGQTGTLDLINGASK